MEEQKEGTVNATYFANLGKELGRFEGETFYIAEHEFGAVYHVYNSMTLAVSSTQTACYETLVDYVRNKDVYAKLEGEEKENFELTLSAISYVLSLPLFTFSSAELTFDLATLIIKHLQKALDNAFNMALQEETKEEDKQFQEAVEGLEAIKKEIAND